MGQYHSVYNRTKKEYYTLGGAKLWEKAHNVIASMGLLVLLSNSNGRGGGDLNNRLQKSTFNDKDPSKPLKTAMYTRWSNDRQKIVKGTKKEFEETQAALNLISGRWAGDKIVIQGDYAEETDAAFIDSSHRDDYKNITPLVVKAFELILEKESDEDSVSLLKIVQFEKQFLGDI